MSIGRPSLAIAIDRACSQIHTAWRRGEAPSTLALSSELYAAVLAERGRERAAGGPILLLDLTLVEDPALVGSDSVVR